jgi:hydroxylamine dehydrogenase
VSRLKPRPASNAIKVTTPGVFADWAKSRHANANITCLDCHLVQPGDQDIAQDHEKYYSRSDMPWGEAKYKMPIASIVTPKDCSRCHPDEATQYSKSKHANTIEIMWKLDPWLNKGMNSDNERKTGCFNCHGTDAIDEKGKIDPPPGPMRASDGSIWTAARGLYLLPHPPPLFGGRGPHARGLRPVPPGTGPSPDRDLRRVQTRHHLSRLPGRVQFRCRRRHLDAGVDYRAPTCAACHMSGSGKEPTSHDVTQRLSWETQAPLTVRPQDFKPFPSGTDWKVERQKMKNICSSCHGEAWINDFYDGFDKAVEEYNEVYFKPAKAKLDELYDKGCWTRPSSSTNASRLNTMNCGTTKGRRARMGVMMMAPDYAWWHGFYECKLRFANYMEEANHLIETGQKAYVAKDFPNATGDTTKPVSIFGAQ